MGGALWSDTTGFLNHLEGAFRVLYLDKSGDVR